MKERERERERGSSVLKELFPIPIPKGGKKFASFICSWINIGLGDFETTWAVHKGYSILVYSCWVLFWGVLLPVTVSKLTFRDVLQPNHHPLRPGCLGYTQSKRNWDHLCDPALFVRNPGDQDLQLRTPMRSGWSR